MPQSMNVRYEDGLVLSVDITESESKILKTGSEEEKSKLLRDIRRRVPEEDIQYAPEPRRQLPTGSNTDRSPQAGSQLPTGSNSDQRPSTPGDETSDESESKGTITKKRWPNAAVDLLLDLMESRMTDLDNPFIVKKDIHDDVSKCMFDKGFPFTPREVDNKWKNMIRQFKRDLARKEKSGASFQRNPVFDQMQRIIGHRHDIKPKHVAGSGLKRANDATDGQNEDKQEKKRKGGNDYKQEMINMMKSNMTYMKEFDDKFLKDREEAQRKRNEQEDRKINLFEQMVNIMSKK